MRRFGDLRSDIGTYFAVTGCSQETQRKASEACMRQGKPWRVLPKTP